MSQNTSYCRSSLLLVAVLLVPASAVRADITYSVIDYSAQEMYGLSGPMPMSGTIVTDGYIGTTSDTSHILSATLTLDLFGCVPFSAYVDPADSTNVIQLNDVEFTSTSIFLPVGAAFYLQGNLTSPTGQSGDIYFEGAQTASTGGSNFIQQGIDDIYAPFWQGSGPAMGGGTLPTTEPWVIATAVPEPASLTLLATALLGLGVFHLRRWMTKCC